MNSLIGQLPEWMRSPAALIAGGLILLFLLVWGLRKWAEARSHGLPSGRGWRGKVPLPNQASPLDAMRAALEASRRIEPLRRTESPPPAFDDIPSAEAVEKALADSQGDAASGSAGDAEPGQAALPEGSEGPSEASPSEDDAAEAEGDAAKVVPLHASRASEDAEETPEAERQEQDGEAAPERAREQKG